MSSTLTLIILGVLTLVLIGWDIFLVLDKIDGNTISEAIGAVSGKSLLLPSALGYLLGHWLWRHPPGSISPLRGKVGLLGITPTYFIALLLLDIFVTPVLPLWAPAAIAAVNIVIGHFAFPLEVDRPLLVTRVITKAVKLLAKKKV